jgi:hypothetical protein
MRGLAWDGPGKIASGGSMAGGASMNAVFYLL